VNVLRRQREDALNHGQDDRAQLINGILENIDRDG
jgi:hypothetical protein